MTKARVTALLAAALVLLVAAPAHADHTFVGVGRALGLEIGMEGEEVTFGFAEAAVQSGPSDDGCGTTRGNACASGAGALLLADSAEAFAPGGAAEDEVDPTALPQDPWPGLFGEIGGARAQASVGSHTSSARGEGHALSAELLAPPDAIADEAYRTGLEALVAALEALPDDVDDPELVERLLAALTRLIEDSEHQPIAAISGGATTTTSDDADGKTTATATAHGTVIVVAPTEANNPPEAPEGLVILEIGEASATASTDQKNAEASFTAPEVTVRVFNPTTGVYDTAEVAPGESTCGAAGTPLEICVTAGDGEDTVEGAGAAAAAAGVAVAAFDDPVPTLELTLAQAEAAVAAATSTTQPNGSSGGGTSVGGSGGSSGSGSELPRTGAGYTLPGLALIATGAAGLLALRRRRA